MRVAEGVLRAVIAHAREAAPEECCGLLLGTPDAIVDSIRARNIADSPSSRFLLDPQDHFDARRAARRRGVDIVGFYHSHPHSPAEPSDTDRADAGYPDHLYLIVGLAGAEPDVRVFQLEHGNFRARGFVTVA